MKAKEWAMIFNDEPNFIVWKSYIQELIETYKKRGSSASAIEGAVREFEQKRLAIEKIVPSADAYGFDNALEDHLPKHDYKTYCDESSKRYAKQVRIIARQKYQQDKQKLNYIDDPMLRLVMRLNLIMREEETVRFAKEICNFS